MFFTFTYIDYMKKMHNFEDFVTDTAKKPLLHLHLFEGLLPDDDDEEEYEDDDDCERPEEGDYSELSWKMDKYMPDDSDVQDEYYEILDDVNLSKEEKIEALEDFFDTNIQVEERFNRMLPENGSIKGFAEYLVNQQEKTKKKKIKKPKGKK